jgi:hypothetical protein
LDQSVGHVNNVLGPLKLAVGCFFAAPGTYGAAQRFYQADRQCVIPKIFDISKAGVSSILGSVVIALPWIVAAIRSNHWPEDGHQDSFPARRCFWVFPMPCVSFIFAPFPCELLGNTFHPRSSTFYAMLSGIYLVR